MITTVKDLKELAEVAKSIIDKYSDDRIFLFYGHMGAGKTTLINELCKALQVMDHTSSPTFSIINEYSSLQGPIYHFDFYRLKDENEAFDMGYEEYFYSRNYCFVEWPEKIANLLPEHYIKISIESADNQDRVLILEKI